MRTDLYRDPKVCIIADQLLDEKGELARYTNQMSQRNMNVTRNVMRNAVIGGLLSVWGVMRHRGKRKNNDLVCEQVSTGVIDDIADLLGLGDALVMVGWVTETDSGVVFERFFEDYNCEPAQASASSGADRQRKYREKMRQKSDVTRDVTRDVTVTTEKRREEKRGEEVNTVRGASSDAPATGGSLGDVPEKPKRGTRLPADWSLPDDWREWSASNTQLTGQQIAIEAEKFRDYWTAQPGAKATKTDWQATWRNWCRSARPLNGTAKPSRHDISQIDYGPGGVYDL